MGTYGAARITNRQMFRQRRGRHLDTLDMRIRIGAKCREHGCRLAQRRLLPVWFQFRRILKLSGQGGWRLHGKGWWPWIFGGR